MTSLWTGFARTILHFSAFILTSDVLGPGRSPVRSVAARHLMFREESGVVLALTTRGISLLLLLLWSIRIPRWPESVTASAHRSVDIEHCLCVVYRRGSLLDWCLIPHFENRGIDRRLVRSEFVPLSPRVVKSVRHWSKSRWPLHGATSCVRASGQEFHRGWVLGYGGPLAVAGRLILSNHLPQGVGGRPARQRQVTRSKNFGRHLTGWGRWLLLSELATT